MSRVTRVVLGAVILACLMAGSSSAGPGGCTNAPTLNPFAFEQITVSTSGIGFTATKYAPAGQTPADLAIVTVESQAIRYRDDGVAPTTSVGHTVAAASTITVCGFQSIKTVLFIRDDASDATLNVSYYRAQ